MQWKGMAVVAAFVGALGVVALPPTAEARCWRGNPVCWPFLAGAAAVGAATTIATAPLRAFAPGPYYYSAPPYGSAYPPPPPYVPPAPGYYGYYGPRPSGY